MRILLTGLLIAAMLAGCSTAGMSRDYSLDQHPGKGVVFASILYDGWYSQESIFIRRVDGKSGQQSLSFGSWFYLWPFIDGGDFAAEDKASIKHDGGVEALELEPGEYVLQAWQADKYEVQLPDDAPRIAFTVKAGEATYLGSYTFDEKTELWDVRGAGAVLRDEFDRDRAIFAKKFPDMHVSAVTDGVLPLSTPIDLGISQ
jgi:hypothetical protein